MGKSWFRNVGWRNELYAVSKDYVPHCILTALRSVEDQVLFHLRSSVPPSSFPKKKCYRMIGANIFSNTARQVPFKSLFFLLCGMSCEHRPYFNITILLLEHNCSSQNLCILGM